METPPRTGLVVPSNLRPLASVDTCQRLLNDILELEPADIAKQDVGLLNLLCAPNLVGSEGLDVARCMARLDNLAAFVKAGTERNYHRFRSDPHYGHCEPMWRMGMLVTIVKLDYGAAYDPDVADDLKRTGDSPFTDSQNIFVHGLLADDPKRRWGSCSSIPVLVAAVSRRLGYPVKLAKNRKHIYARWDDGQGFAFNVEASNPAGMTVLSDDYYRSDPIYGPAAERERSRQRPVLPLAHAGRDVRYVPADAGGHAARHGPVQRNAALVGPLAPVLAHATVLRPRRPPSGRNWASSTATAASTPTGRSRRRSGTTSSSITPANCCGWRSGRCS